MKMQFRSIRLKLLGVVAATTLVALLVTLAGIGIYDLRVYHRNLVADMTTQAELLGQMTSPALTFDDQDLAKQNLALLRIRSKVRAAAIYNERGELFASFNMPGETEALPQRPAAEGIVVENGRLTLFRHVEHEGVALGTVYLRADYELVSRMLDYLGLALLLVMVAMLIAYLMMRRLEGFVTRPISEIVEVARGVVEQRNYAQRANVSSNDEIGVLVKAFNDMLAEIERRTGELETSNREIAREAHERGLAQQEIMRLNAELERRVHERTEQLESANQELGLAKESAEHASRSKSAFLSSMSHELRTPLNAILGFSQILVSDSLPSTLEQKKKFASHILKAGRHLLTLINEILDLAKIESGAINLSVEMVEVAEVLRECQTMIDPLASARGVRVMFPKSVEFGVMSDRTRLKQILLNLLSNAVKYNREMGTVVVACTAAGYEKVRISVQDTGNGLSDEQLAGLFQPFNRLGQEGGSEEGSGIGLVVTKRLIESMGGEIGVSSTVGIGSVFWIELKYAAPVRQVVLRDVAVAAALLNERPAVTGQQTLLYVEDNPANLKLVEEILHFRQDLRLLSAPDAHSGIELANRELPNVILMDINLPGMSGTDALKTLKAAPRTSHIPVIALTANAMPKDIERGLEAGFFRYLTKPIIIDEFNAALEEALQTAQQINAKDAS